MKKKIECNIIIEDIYKVIEKLDDAVLAVLFRAAFRFNALDLDFDKWNAEEFYKKEHREYILKAIEEVAAESKWNENDLTAEINGFDYVVMDIIFKSFEFVFGLLSSSELPNMTPRELITQGLDWADEVWFDETYFIE